MWLPWILTLEGWLFSTECITRGSSCKLMKSLLKLNFQLWRGQYNRRLHERERRDKEQKLCNTEDSGPSLEICLQVSFSFVILACYIIFSSGSTTCIFPSLEWLWSRCLWRILNIWPDILSPPFRLVCQLWPVKQLWINNSVKYLDIVSLVFLFPKFQN